MQPKIIYSSNTNGDEELLIPFASDIRNELAAQQEKQQQQFQIVESQRPPSCLACCNTRIGCYIIAALQVAFGFFHLIYAISAVTDPENGNFNGDQDDQESNQDSSFSFQFYAIGLYAVYMVASGLMLFQGISYQKGNLLKPSIILSFFMIVALLCQFAYIKTNWDSFSNQLRNHLKYYCNDAEQKIVNDIRIDQEAYSKLKSLDEAGYLENEKYLPELSSMLADENEELAIWQEIDAMVNDDKVWENSTKSYLLILVGGFMTWNVFVVCVGFWILMKQFSWMKRVGQVWKDGDLRRY